MKEIQRNILKFTVKEWKRNKHQRGHIENSKMVSLIPSMFIIIFNVNGLIKKQRFSDGIKKQDTTIYYL